MVVDYTNYISYINEITKNNEDFIDILKTHLLVV